MLSPMKRIILCADDYGLNTAVSQGIIALLRLGRLSAVSCMTTSPLWPQFSSLLKPYRQQADIGLHFNLTEGKPLSDAYSRRYGNNFFTLPQLIIRAFLGQLNREAIEQECEAQLNQFVAETGVLPDFIDGHQHIHQLPIIRKAVVNVYLRYLNNRKAYIRATYRRVRPYSRSAHIKQIIIGFCGASGLKQLLKKHTIPHNPIFGGIYSFGSVSQYGQAFSYFINNIRDLGLIMCHPGLQNEKEKDPISSARFGEYLYLSSPQFVTDCEALGVELIKGVDSLYFSGTM
jgi:chitin disaccharide deacetylase